MKRKLATFFAALLAIQAWSQSLDQPNGPATLERAQGLLRNSQPLSKSEKQERAQEFKKLLKSSKEMLLAEAGRGNIESMFYLGASEELFRANGLATPGECIPWLRKAAELGFPKAPFELADFLSRQQDLPKRMEAIGWYQVGAKIGDQTSRRASITALVKLYTYGSSDLSIRRSVIEAMKWADYGAQLEGIETEDFLSSYGMVDPHKVPKRQIRMQ